MSQASHEGATFRFGSFDVDLQSGEVRRSGVKIKLQEQPFQILVTLLERPGEVVTREELQRKLWTADTFVDFDNGLNIAVKKLRVALGDDAESPRYIETLPRRGYRFIGSVERKPVTDKGLGEAPQPRAAGLAVRGEETSLQTTPKTKPRTAPVPAAIA